jgi:hypothetical protein
MQTTQHPQPCSLLLQQQNILNSNFIREMGLFDFNAGWQLKMRKQAAVDTLLCSLSAII